MNEYRNFGRILKYGVYTPWYFDYKHFSVSRFTSISVNSIICVVGKYVFVLFVTLKWKMDITNNKNTTNFITTIASEKKS